MQLGTRWTAGGDPPARLPEEVVAAVRGIEAGLDDDPPQRWTLTWLEGRPVVELDDGTTVRVAPDGSVSVDS